VTFPKTRPPHNIRVLHGWLREYARERGQAEGRLKRAVDYTLVLAALDRVWDSTGNRMFAIKGGVAMELRLRLDARATRDLDAVFLGAFEEWLEALDNALAQPVADFDFSRGEPTTIRTTRTMRVDVYLDYRGRRWGTVTLEVAPAEGGHVLGVDEVEPFNLAQFGLPALENVPVVGLPYLVAQKLHACTEQLDDRDNPRVRDLIDLQLVRRLLRDDDLPRVRDACVAIFETRGTHQWPPDLVAPATWPAAYKRLVEEEKSAVEGGLDGAIRSVQGLIREIDGANPVVEVTDPRLDGLKSR
jgi:hypothetical protein